MFNFTDYSKKIKYQLLIFSGVCLFIASSGSLPKEISVIGLDLSDKQNVAGWFLFVVTLYFSIKFILAGTFELVGYKLPNLVLRLTKNLQGDVIGLTESDVHGHYYDHEHDYQGDGTPSGELDSIKLQREAIYARYNRYYIYTRNGWTYISDFLFPVIFSIYSIYALHTMLKTGYAFEYTAWLN